MIKIVSWNIRQGGGTRIAKIAETLIKTKAHMLVCSEYRNQAKGIFLRHKLLEAGYRFQYVTAATSEANAVLIASKIDGHSRLHKSPCGYGYCVASVDFEAFSLHGVYLPHKKKHDLFDILLAEASVDRPSIIVGDYNTGKNGIDQRGDSFWYTDELRELEEAGMVDAFRQMHGNLETYSWRSHQGNGYRYDHSYVHQDLVPLIKACDYDHTVREQGLSDHSLMWLELG